MTEPVNATSQVGSSAPPLPMEFHRDRNIRFRAYPSFGRAPTRLRPVWPSRSSYFPPVVLAWSFGVPAEQFPVYLEHGFGGARSVSPRPAPTDGYGMRAPGSGDSAETGGAGPSMRTFTTRVIVLREYHRRSRG